MPKKNIWTPIQSPAHPFAVSIYPPECNENENVLQPNYLKFASSLNWSVTLNKKTDKQIKSSASNLCFLRGAEGNLLSSYPSSNGPVLPAWRQLREWNKERGQRAKFQKRECIMKGTPLSLSLYSPLSPNSNGATISTTRVSPNTPEHNARARHETRATEVCTGGGPSALIKGSSGRAALSPSRTVLTAHKRTPQKRRNPFSLFFGLFISVSRWSAATIYYCSGSLIV